MRKINKKNKISFNIFGVCLATLIIAFTMVIVNVMANSESAYDVKKGSIIYDYDNNYIDVASDGQITKKWNGEYYLKLDNGGDYKLGNESVVYNPTMENITLFGKAYQVFSDGTVSKTAAKYDISDVRSTSIYKLTDRKYVVVGKEIRNDKESFKTNAYLMVYLDKNGNSLLMNQKFNIKSIDPLVLLSDEMSFDVANEKVVFGDKKEIDLKKINGSTNEYVAKQNQTTADGETDATDDVTNGQTSNSGGGAVSSVGGSSGNYGGSGSGTGSGSQVIVGGGGGSSGNSQNSSNGSSNNKDEEDKDTTTDNKVDHQAYLSLRGLSPNVTTIDVYYAIQDISDYYNSVYIKVESDDEVVATYDLNKANNAISVIGLKPNSQYTISLCCKYNTTVNGEIKEINQVVDTLTTQTAKIQAAMKITKIADNKVYFNLKLNANYVLESAKIKLYRNEEKTAISNIDVQVNKASREGGWSASLSLNDFDVSDKIVLRLEDVYYNGEPVDYTISAKSLNYETSSSGNLFDMFMNMFK